MLVRWWGSDKRLPPLSCRRRTLIKGRCLLSDCSPINAPFFEGFVGSLLTIVPVDAGQLIYRNVAANFLPLILLNHARNYVQAGPVDNAQVRGHRNMIVYRYEETQAVGEH
jgi:hypothetical protein